MDIAWILPYILGISGFWIKRNAEVSIYAQFIDFITEIQSPWNMFRKYHMIQYTITNKMTNLKFICLIIAFSEQCKC